MRFDFVLICACFIFVTADQRIINGEDAIQGQFPWHVGILSLKPYLEMLFCGGAIISDQWILTTAHCINGAEEIGVYSGVVRIDDFDRVVSTSKTYLIHEEFDDLTLKNDIGLIYLDQPLILSDNTSIISLNDEEVAAGTIATFSGWGHSYHDSDKIDNMTLTLQYAFLNVIDNPECGKFYHELITPGVICTVGDDPETSPCFGDSGGALVITVNDRPVHIGVMSFLSGLGCEQGYPVGYTRSSYYRTWIKKHTGV